MNVPVLILVALAGPLAWAVTYWLTNRPEHYPECEPGATELEFEARESLTFGLSHEYLPEFLYELQSKFEHGWTRGHVSTLLMRVVDRRIDCAGRYLVTADGTSDELLLRFCQTNRDSVLCCLEMPKAFLSIVRRVAAGYPMRAAG